MDVAASIIWRRLDEPGHEVCRLISLREGWELAGTAVFLHAGQPVELQYAVRCDQGFRTRSAQVNGWIGAQAVKLDFESDNVSNWRLNGKPCPEVAGCIDLDLNFTPATNLLQIRRLPLPLGEPVRVRTAWLSFPDLTLTCLEQIYRRTLGNTFAYEAPSLDFATDLKANEHGFITDYPPLWLAETVA